MQHMAVISIPCTAVITSVGQFSSKEVGLIKLTNLGFTHTNSALLLCAMGHNQL